MRCSPHLPDLIAFRSRSRLCNSELKFGTRSRRRTRQDRDVGKHTGYWQAYRQTQVRKALLIMLAVLGWVLLAVLIVVLESRLGALFPVAMIAILIGLVGSIVVIVRNAYRVACPECGTVYRRTKWGGQCPSCGLRLLQDDPVPRSSG